MSAFYQEADAKGDFDYNLHIVPVLGNTQFRGAPPDLEKPFLAFIGAAQTFGRFSHEPFAILVGERLGLPILNLGVGGAGPRHFNRRNYLDVLNKADLVVMQVLSGRSSSCSLFDNSRSNGMRGKTPFSLDEMRVDEFYKSINERMGEAAVRQAADEMRRDYQANFIELLAGITRPKILLWLSSRSPDYADDYANVPYGVFSKFPQLVNRGMVEELKAFSDAYVECVSETGLPQRLWPSTASIKGAVSRNGMLENTYYPSPQMHREAAEALVEPCRRFTGRYSAKPTRAKTSFVVVGSERTGTNLLIGMLNQYPSCYCGGELFNSSQIEKDRMPWKYIADADLPRLVALRKTDPIALWRELCASSKKSGIRTAGFKLLYKHGLANEAILAELVADKDVSVIHVVRRNQLRRHVSERQARAAQKWAFGAAEPVPAMAVVEISVNDMVRSFQESANLRDDYDARFSSHRLFTVIYEDLSERPEETVGKVAEFLGLSANGLKVRPTFRKTGTDRIPDSLADYEALRAKFRLWSSYFD